MQTVYPRFGIGHELDSVTMAMGREKHRNARFGNERGLGRYGMNSENHLKDDYMVVAKGRPQRRTSKHEVEPSNQN